MAIVAALFDLDGTLLDSEAYIHGAFRAVLAGAGAPAAPPAAPRGVIGHALEECYRQLAPGLDAHALCEAHRQWQSRHLDMVRAMPGAHALLDALRSTGMRLAVVTNRSRRSSIASLDHVDLLARVEEVVSSEDVTRQKPDPEPVRLALARLEVAAACAVMVGDTAVDIAAGRAAGTRTVAVDFGRRHASVAPERPDAIVHALDELRTLFAEW